MVKLSLDPYNMELMKRGIGGAPMTRKEAIIASGKGVDPSTVVDSPRTLVDDLQRFGINLQNILKAGGLSQANLPATPQGIEAAVKKVTEAGGVKEGKTPDDFVPFDPTTLPNVKIFESTPGPEGPKLVEDLSNSALGSKVIPSDLAGGRGTVIEKPGDRTKAQRAEEFREKEAARVEMQGGLKSQPIEGQEEDASVTAFLSSMDEFINSARESAPYKPTERSIKEYKRAFAEATGIDISGKPDKSSALMALGLALMQNRAGSGFNVGNILRAVGQAGEVALPKLEAAKIEARNNAIAAGKYALEAQAADKATDAANFEKQLNRPGYYIFERGTDIEDGNKKFKDGKIVYLNPRELNELITNPDFDERFSFIEKSEYIDVMKELSKPVELGEMWVKGDPKAFSLIGGDPKDVPPALQVLSHAKNPNYEGETPSRRLLAEEDEDVKNRFVRYQTDIAKNTEKLNELIKNLQAGVSFPKQIAGTVQQIAKSLGLNVDTSTTAKSKQALANIAIDNVLQILKESGRTISEGERQRAEKRVSKVDLSLEGSDLDLILNQVEYVYDMVVTDAQKNLDMALDTFENQFGYSVMPKISQEELDAINAKREEDGLEPRKMSDF